jgi:Zn-dependent membrane protease YugP
VYFDYYYLVLVAPTLLLSLFAQILVKSTFAKYSRVPSGSGLSGRAAAALLMREAGVPGVSIQPVGGALTDHYDPGSKALRLSRPVYDSTSIAAVGVAAHETGHAIQHARSYGPLALRSALVPAAKIGSSAGPWLAVAGFLFSIPLLVNAGIILFGAAVLFYVVTLPVEFNASSRAIAILRASGTLREDELRGVKKVLAAAALTYVASALTALMSFLRLVLISRNKRRG